MRESYIGCDQFAEIEPLLLREKTVCRKLDFNSIVMIISRRDEYAFIER